MTMNDTTDKQSCQNQQPPVGNKIRWNFLIISGEVMTGEIGPVNAGGVCFIQIASMAKESDN